MSREYKETKNDNSRPLTANDKKLLIQMVKKTKGKESQ